MRARPGCGKHDDKGELTLCARGITVGAGDCGKREQASPQTGGGLLFTLTDCYLSERWAERCQILRFLQKGEGQ